MVTNEFLSVANSWPTAWVWAGAGGAPGGGISMHELDSAGTKPWRVCFRFRLSFASIVLFEPRDHMQSTMPPPLPPLPLLYLDNSTNFAQLVLRFGPGLQTNYGNHNTHAAYT